MSGNASAEPLGSSGIQPWCKLAFSRLLSGLLSIVTVSPRFVSTTVFPKGIGPEEVPPFTWLEAAVSTGKWKAGSHQ